MRRSPEHDLRAEYRLRILACLAASLLLVTLVLRFWPSLPEQTEDRIFSTEGEERVLMKEIQPTSQGREAPPPPPMPLPPVVVPDEVVLERENLDLDRNLLSTEELSPKESPTGTPGEGATASQVQVGPRPVRFVEPEYTAAARRRDIRAAVTVQVLIDERGRVQQARITERQLLDEENQPAKQVEQLGYGLEKAALAAARQWRFRPAQQDGEAVESYTTLTFSFGV